MSPASPQDRIAAAEVRAIDAHKSVARKAKAILAELDQATDVGFHPKLEIHDEDSAVIVLEQAAEQHKKVATTR